MTYSLFLDDERLPEHVTWKNIPRVPYQVVRNYEEFVITITDHGIPTFVTFDHDLADEHYLGLVSNYTFNDGELVKTFEYKEKTGFDCAKWLVEHCIERGVRFPDYEVHSMNPIGAERIIQYVEWAKTKVDTL